MALDGVRHRIPWNYTIWENKHFELEWAWNKSKQKIEILNKAKSK
jgi:hypothetical protein